MAPKTRFQFRRYEDGCLQCGLPGYHTDDTRVCLNAHGLKGVLYLGNINTGYIWSFLWRRRDGRSKRWDTIWKGNTVTDDCKLFVRWCSGQCFGLWLVQHLAADEAAE